MNKYLSICVVVLLAALACSSCSLDDNDNHAEAEVGYVGVVDSIRLTDQADTSYYKFIEEALCSEKIKVAGQASLFTQKAKVENATLPMAVAICDSMAFEYYAKVLQGVSLDDIKSAIFDAHTNTITQSGVTDRWLVPISPFTAYISLFSSNRGEAVKRFSREFR